MSLPPMWIYFRIQKFGIWLPFFFIWPLILIMIIIIIPFTIVIDLLLWFSGNRYHHFTRLAISSLIILSALKGFHAQVQGTNTNIDIQVI